MRDDDPWSIPLPALQHFLYCPRQCGWIHLEQVWTENTQTAQGRLLHQRADQPGTRPRRGVRTVTAMPLSHPVLGIHGVADVVEFTGSGEDARALPVEYKRGRPKEDRADVVHRLMTQRACEIGQQLQHHWAPEA